MVLLVDSEACWVEKVDNRQAVVQGENLHCPQKWLTWVRGHLSLVFRMVFDLEEQRIALEILRLLLDCLRNGELLFLYYPLLMLLHIGHLRQNNR